MAFITLGFSISDRFQFSSVAQSCPTLCDPMNHSTPGLPVHHQLPEFTQTGLLVPIYEDQLHKTWESRYWILGYQGNTWLGLASATISNS